MTPRFGDRARRAAEDRAAAAEVARLCALAPRELAVELMAAFGPDGASALVLRGGAHNLIGLTEWLLQGHARAGPHQRALAGPVRDALRVLEEAGLVQWGGSEIAGAKARVRASALGLVVLRQGNVADYLPAPEG